MFRFQKFTVHHFNYYLDGVIEVAKRIIVRFADMRIDEEESVAKTISPWREIEKEQRTNKKNDFDFSHEIIYWRREKNDAIFFSLDEIQ